MPEKVKIEKSGDITVLDYLPVHFAASAVLQRLRFHPEIKFNAGDIENLVRQILQQDVPRALYKTSRVTAAKDSLKIEGQEFKNPLLQVNLDRVDQVFLFVLTVGEGPELLSEGDPGRIYTLNIIRDLLLTGSVDYLRRYIVQNHHLDYLWQLIPGETQAWPVSGRREIIALFGKSIDAVRIKLKADDAFDPPDSACGLFYFADIELEACQVCAQDPCMGRRAPFSQELAEKFADRARRPCGRFKRSAS